MKYIKLFENFENDDENNESLTPEEIAEEIDNWIDSNEDYMSADSLEDKLKELIGSDEIEVTEKVEKSSEGDEYGENWSTTIICAKYKEQDLMKVCVNNSKAYDFGKNSIAFRGLPSNKVVTAGGFGVRFFFDKSLL